MKYTSPTYSLEALTTEDIMNASVNVTQANGKTTASMSFMDLIVNKFTKE
ncbi:MAG: hypothetical protein J6B34_04410 [Clostridia bacterium]|nr:hypothetical protein [Clostridia bacterium]